MLRRHLYFVALSGLFPFAISSCGSARIISQADADALSACPTITGDIVLATNAAGAIKLDGPKSVTGNLLSEQCTNGEGEVFPQLGYIDIYNETNTEYIASNCTGLLSLSSSTLASVTGDFNLQGLLTVTNITFPLLKSVGSAFYLDGVPILSILSVPNLSSMESFHLAFAQNLTSVALDSITNVSSVEINDVGLYALPNLDIADGINSLAIGGIPNIAQLTLTTSPIGTLSVTGNGFLALYLYLAPDTDIKTATKNGSITSFYVSGCSEVRADISMSIQSFTAVGNSFTNLALDSVNISNLYLQSNAQLTELTFPNITLDNVVIADNPSLSPARGLGWQARDVTSFVMKGSFGPGVIGSLGTLNKVTAQFVISSTDSSVDCSSFNRLRKAGNFQGVYNCQGNTTAISSAVHVLTPRYVEVFLSAAFVAGLMLV